MIIERTYRGEWPHAPYTDAERLANFLAVWEISARDASGKAVAERSAAGGRLASLPSCPAAPDSSQPASFATVKVLP